MPGYLSTADLLAGLVPTPAAGRKCVRCGAYPWRYEVGVGWLCRRCCEQELELGDDQ